MSLKIIALLIFIRIASVFVIQTFFSPDEYYQSLEIGHKLAFGYGYTTWEWTKGIRNYLYPALIGLVYKILDVLKLDTDLTVILLPRLLQALLAAYADYRFYCWCDRKKWSVFIVATSWFWFYTGSRTLINSVEASLTSIALSFFPWGPKQEKTGFLWIVGILAYIRPTSIVTWLPICIYHINKSRYSVWELLVKRYSLIGLTIGSLMIALDSYFHGSFIVTPYEFFKVNVLEGVGSFYGSHPFYWYFSSGFPAILGISIVPFYLAVVNTMQNWSESKERQVILTSIIFTVFAFSFLPHKEFRFLLQILPMCLYIISSYLSNWSRNKNEVLIWIVALVILVANVVPAGYLGFVHQQGTIKVMGKISEIAKNNTQEGRNVKIFFIMPCHSTPYYSHVHANITMRFLNCDPNFTDPKYVDEADKFYEAPMKWIRQHLPVHPVEALPSHVVVFDTLAPKISDFLSIYKPLEVFFHSDYLVSLRGGKNVILFERIDFAKPKAQKKVEDDDSS